MPWAAMDMNMGVDGLESEHPILKSEDSDECYRKLLEVMEDFPTFGRVVKLDDDGKYVWTQGTPDKNYPHVVEAPFPDFYLARMRSSEKWRWERGEAPWQNIDMSKIDFSKVLVNPPKGA